MQQETKSCQNCHRDFVIEPDDFAFYEKIKVPPPTWCYLCRFQRRGVYRNQMNLYSIKCGLCGRQTLTMYAPGNLFPVYCQSCWWSDKWDSLSYGKDYDFSKTFFVQHRKLLERTPRLALSNRNAVNSEYCNYADHNKNCYLLFSAGDNEDCLYSGPQFLKNKSSINCAMTVESEQCYSLVDCRKSYGLHYSQNCENCLSSAFLFNCKNCENCIGCVNLRNKKYHIFNQPYIKEEYEKRLKEYNFGSYKNVQIFQDQFQKFLYSQLHRYMQSTNCANVTGDSVVNSKDCFWCFSANNSEKSKYSYIINGTRDCYDVNGVYPATELSYDSYSIVRESARVKFSITAITNCIDIEYSDSCASVQYLFGCISVKNKKYCILNKQYSKEEFEALRKKIIQHMSDMPYVDKKGRVYKYGEFFPPEFSPFGYNDTLAQEFFPKTMHEVESEGWRWQDPIEKDIKITIKTEELPDDTINVDDSITGAIIECAHKKQCNEACTGAFKIIEPELAFHKKHGLALPRICVKCRAFERIKKRNPLQLWHRQCMCDYKIYNNSIKHSHHLEGRCPNEFQTSYSPDRPEIVYCEQCYNAEVV